MSCSPNWTAWTRGLKTAGAADQADRLPGKTARLVRAWPFRDVIAALDFVPVISGEQNDPADWADWTDKAKQEAVITQFKKPLPAEGDADPEHTSPVAFLIVKSMLLTGFDAPAEQVMYLDRHIKEAELLQAIARVNRTAHGKNAGYVVDYYGVAENLKVALAAYAAEDVEGAMTSIADQVPLLAERRQRVRNLFEARGIDRFDTQADQDACVEALADERLRAAFEAAFKLFTMSMEIVLPRPEALPFVPDAKAFGAIAFAARRRYRDEAGFDASLYGSKVRRLIDDHVEALGIEQKIPPISITAADFDAKVADLHSDRAKASEMEHAIRYHLREHWDEDPEHYARLSERLEEIIEELGEQWEQLALALGDLLPEVRAGRQADDSGLDPVTEAPFYDLLKRELAEEGKPSVQPGRGAPAGPDRGRGHPHQGRDQPGRVLAQHLRAERAARLGRDPAGRADDRRGGPVRLHPHHPGRRPPRRAGQGQPRPPGGQLMPPPPRLPRRYVGDLTSRSGNPSSGAPSGSPSTGTDPCCCTPPPGPTRTRSPPGPGPNAAGCSASSPRNTCCCPPARPRSSSPGKASTTSAATTVSSSPTTRLAPA